MACSPWVYAEEQSQLWVVPREWKQLLGQVQRHQSTACSSSACLSALSPWIRAGLPLPGMDNPKEHPASQGSRGKRGDLASVLHGILLSALQLTRIILPQIQFRVKYSTDCNYMCISPCFHLEGCWTKALPPGNPSVQAVTGSSPFCEAASQHSYKEIIPGHHTVLL